MKNTRFISYHFCHHIKHSSCVVHILWLPRQSLHELVYRHCVKAWRALILCSD